VVTCLKTGSSYKREETQQIHGTVQGQGSAGGNQERQDMNEIGSESGVHPSQVVNLKKELEEQA
jgi:hypothetical protein